jgi:hypothetical protein
MTTIPGQGTIGLVTLWNPVNGMGILALFFKACHTVFNLPGALKRLTCPPGKSRIPFLLGMAPFWSWF